MTITNAICGHSIYKREESRRQMTALDLLERVRIRSPQPSYFIKPRR